MTFQDLTCNHRQYKLYYNVLYCYSRPTMRVTSGEESSFLFFYLVLGNASIQWPTLSSTVPQTVSLSTMKRKTKCKLCTALESIDRIKKDFFNVLIIPQTSILIRDVYFLCIIASHPDVILISLHST